MVEKKKKLIVDCTICKKRVEFEVPANLADKREYYPFEYIAIHGNPEHASMLFLDKNLAVRDVVAYADLNIAKKQSENMLNLARMSRTESFAYICTDLLRITIYQALMTGPKSTDDLIALLKDKPDFKSQDLFTLLLPMVKTGVVKSLWLKGTTTEVYLLVRDFLLLRTFPTVSYKIFSEDKRFKKQKKEYLKRINENLMPYQENLLKSPDLYEIEMRNCGKLLMDKKVQTIFAVLRTGPKNQVDLLGLVDDGVLSDLIHQKIIGEMRFDNVPYYFLLYDITVNEFPPEYLLRTIAENIKDEKIPPEVAVQYLDILYEYAH